MRPECKPVLGRAMVGFHGITSVTICVQDRFRTRLIMDEDDQYVREQTTYVAFNPSIVLQPLLDL